MNTRCIGCIYMKKMLHQRYIVHLHRRDSLFQAQVEHLWELLDLNGDGIVHCFHSQEYYQSRHASHNSERRGLDSAHGSTYVYQQANIFRWWWEAPVLIPHCLRFRGLGGGVTYRQIKANLKKQVLWIIIEISNDSASSGDAGRTELYDAVLAGQYDGISEKSGRGGKRRANVCCLKWTFPDQRKHSLHIRMLFRSRSLSLYVDFVQFCCFFSELFRIYESNDFLLSPSLISVVIRVGEIAGTWFMQSS